LLGSNGSFCISVIEARPNNGAHGASSEPALCWAEGGGMAKVRARVTGHRKLYIHNTLEGAAHFTKGVIEKKIKEGKRDGIGFDYMICAVMLAFSFEAKLNFMGAKYAKPWNEWTIWKTKANHVFNAIGIKPDWTKRPYTSLEKMKAFRDKIAHGKPLKEDLDYEVTGEQDEIRASLNLRQAWEAMVTHEEVMQSYDDTEQVWQDMIKKSQIDVHELIDQAEFSIEVLQRLDA
jgi:hypothetical protein